MKYCFVYLVFAVLAFVECIPDYFPSCKRNDPELEKCFLEGIEALKPKLKDGIPEINLPPLDPFKMEYLFINTSLTGAKMKAVISNIVAYGGSNFNIKYLKFDLDNKYAASIEVEFPQLSMTAEYNTRGSRMLFFAIDGRGNIKGNFSNVSVVAKCVASPVDRDGKQYLQLDTITTSVSIDKGSLDADPAEWSIAGSAASSFIRSSPSVVLSIFAPVIDDTAASIAKQYLNDVLATLPLDEVLLP